MFPKGDNLSRIIIMHTQEWYLRGENSFQGKGPWARYASASRSAFSNGSVKGCGSGNQGDLLESVDSQLTGNIKNLSKIWPVNYFSCHSDLHELISSLKVLTKGSAALVTITLSYWSHWVTYYLCSFGLVATEDGRIVFTQSHVGGCHLY